MTRLALLILLVAAGVLVIVFVPSLRESGERSGRAGPARDLSGRTTPADGGASERPPVETSKEDHVRLRGRVVVIDARGGEHGSESGTFTLYAKQGGRAEDHRVQVSDGHWTANVPAAGQLTFHKLRFGGRTATLPDPAAVEVPLDGEVVLRAHWWPRSVLRVVDRHSGADLREVELVQSTHWENSNDIHVGKAAHTVVARRMPSPIVLPEAMGTEIYWARAPGYAWHRVAVDHRSGGERLVRLVSGGSLEIELRNYEPGRGVRVQLRAAVAPETKRPLMSIDPGAEARILLESVVPGSFEVRAAIGPWFREAPPLAKERTRVVAGARATVTLTLAMPPETSRVPLAGTIEVPEAWGKVHLRLTIQPPKGTGAAPIEVPREAIRRTEPGVWHWDTGGVVPGRYIVEIHPFATQRIVEVGAAGNGHVRLRVPEPAEVHVKVLDPATGSHATDARVEWWTKRAEPGLGGSMAPARWDGKRELFRMRVPVGEVEFYISAAGVSMSERRTTKPGRNEFMFRIKRNCGLQVVLVEGDATVPFDPDFTIEAEHLDGDGAVVHGESGHTKRTLWFSEPGRYRVTFSRLADFDPIPDRAVTLEAGKIAVLTVALTRS